MKNHFLKAAIRSAFFRPSTVRTIRFGPLRGMVFRCGPITGLSPWYSGTERAHQRMFRSLVQSGDVVIDIGANWGLHSLYLSRLVGPDGLVLSIEPYSPARSELQWHLQANKCRNVKVLGAAVSDSDGYSYFTSGLSAATGALLDVVGGSFSGSSLLSVNTRTLDSLIKELEINRPVRLVKVDVEGAESRVLKGASWTTKTHRPHFIIDLHTPQEDVKAAEQLNANGYKLSRLSGPPILNPSKGWPESCGVWGSILASPSN